MSEFVSKKVHKPRLNHGSDHSYSSYDGDNHGTKKYRSNPSDPSDYNTALYATKTQCLFSRLDPRSAAALRSYCAWKKTWSAATTHTSAILHHVWTCPACDRLQAGLAMKRARTQGPVSQELMLLLQSTEHRAFPSSRHGFHGSTLSRPDRFNPLFVAVLSRSDEPGRQLTTDSGQRHRKTRRTRAIKSCVTRL